ncbi:MAG: hypothetical protein HYS13_21810 [Planctomycetia bacterium]|nr:hypothetical protein [Planctomycetia bacterium]
MTAKRRENGRRKPSACALVANGVSGQWEIALDETVEGAQRWFAQIDGPLCYVYFQIQQPRVIEDMLLFLQRHLSAPTDKERSTGQADQMELGPNGGNSVTLLWDGETNDRCFILIRGKGEFRARLCLAGTDLNDVVHALHQVRDELCEEGVLAKAS